MAGSSLLTLIDDIASLLDDVAVLTKVAAKKTAGVLGDDLALNAQQVAGVRAERELPVVLAVAKGSLLNKLILVPAALAISALAPWLVIPLLMFGGAFLCYEGCHKLVESWFGGEARKAHHDALVAKLADPTIDVVAAERAQIRGAIRTDLVLSAEIIAITLGTVADESFAMRVAVLSTIALAMTIGVYGFVAGLVKLDDVGLYLHTRASRLARGLGALILWMAPRLMRLLAIAGTLAMFVVGGGILVHGIGPVARWLHELEVDAASVSPGGAVLEVLVGPVGNLIVGVVVGLLALGLVAGAAKVWRAVRS